MDALGDRMKDIESRTRYMLPRRVYTLIRIDGKAFHTYTKGCDKPFDLKLKSAMQITTKQLCENIQGCKIGYTQSDEITLLLTDFDDINTCAWFDGNLQKISSVTASLATGFFNRERAYQETTNFYTPAFFDARVWTTSDPWEAYNTFLWRQKDATKNSIQMVARSLASHKECEGKNFSQLNELIFTKGKNFNDYDTDSKRGAFIIKDENGWNIDKEPPILSEDKNYFFEKIPTIPQFLQEYWKTDECN
jgi:tRNA(His) guanylyltransferase